MSQEACTVCHGDGGWPADADEWDGRTKPQPCSACDGTGLASHQIAACSWCHGDGYDYDPDTGKRVMCTPCQGSGVG